VHRRFRYLPDQHDDRIRRSPRLTLAEMAIESFYPANARTAGYMRTRAEENKLNRPRVGGSAGGGHGIISLVGRDRPVSTNDRAGPMPRRAGRAPSG